MFRKMHRKASMWHVRHLTKKRKTRLKQSADYLNQMMANHTRDDKCCVCCHSVCYRNVSSAHEQQCVSSRSGVLVDTETPHKVCVISKIGQNNYATTDNRSNESNMVPVNISDSGASLPFNGCQIHGRSVRSKEPVADHTSDHGEIVCVELDIDVASTSLERDLNFKGNKIKQLKKKKCLSKTPFPLDQASITESQCNLLQISHSLCKSHSKTSVLEKNLAETTNNNRADFNDTYSTNRHYSAPNLYSHYYHHHHVFPDRAKQRNEPAESTKLVCDMITSIKDNELYNSTIHTRKPSQGTISWNSLVHSECEATCPAEPNPKSLRNVEESNQPCPHHRQHSKKLKKAHERHHHHKQNSCSSGRSPISDQISSVTFISCKRCCPSRQTQWLSFIWERFRKILQKLVNHNYFKQAIFLAILLNTLSMGIEYHNQPLSLSNAVEISNAIFTGELGEYIRII